MTKQRTGYPVNVSEEDWHVENNERFQPGQIVVSESGLVVAHVYIHEEAALIVREHNAHRKLTYRLSEATRVMLAVAGELSKGSKRIASDIEMLERLHEEARAALALAEVQQ